MRDDLVPGAPFPDLRLPDHTARERSLSELADGQPLVLNFVRGWWCPKEQVRLRMLVSMQEAIQREYGAIVAVTVDEPYVNGALRAGLGADFPFLSDQERPVARDLDLLELTDSKHLPYLPFTFVLDSLLGIHGVWCGFWYWGNPTPEELRQALREITRHEQPTFDPQPVWRDADGREIQRGRFDGEEPEVGDELGKSAVDGRPWLVHSVERDGNRVAIHLRKGGEADTSREVRHSITAPPHGSGF